MTLFFETQEKLIVVKGAAPAGGAGVVEVKIFIYYYYY